MLSIRTVTLAAAGLMIWTSGSDAATQDPTGVWFDHNGRGAVEIAPCASGKGFCGYVVHIKEAKHADRCGLQILGHVTSNGGGWIYSPDRGKKYSVELTRLSDGQLRVVGNAGSFFSKTYTWNRAPDDVARCGEQTATAPAKPVEPHKADAPAAQSAPQEQASSDTPTGASSGAMALIGASKKQRIAAAAPATETLSDADAPPAVTTEKAPAATEKQTAAAPAPVEDEEGFVPERKCKFKIPYVGRVIMVPCRD